MTRWCQVTPDAVAAWLAADVVDQGAPGRSAEEAFGLPVNSVYASISGYRMAAHDLVCRGRPSRGSRHLIRDTYRRVHGHWAR